MGESGDSVDSGVNCLKAPVAMSSRTNIHNWPALSDFHSLVIGVLRSINPGDKNKYNGNNHWWIKKLHYMKKGMIRNHILHNLEILSVVACSQHENLDLVGYG